MKICRFFFRFALVFLAAALLSPPASEQKARGVQPLAAEGEETTPSRRILVVIGIDKYRNWLKLDTAVSDAMEMSELLHASGFIQIVPPLLDKDANKENILHVIEDVLPEKLQPNDDLIIFFAGHGTSQKRKVGNEVFQAGYIVPVEAAGASENKWSEYISLGHLLETIGGLPARHILLILDSCRSGVALGRVVELSHGDAGGSASARVSRRVITSADADENASDAGPVPGHSLFTGVLIKGIETADAELLDKNGEITDSELATFLHSRVRKAPGSNQTPQWGRFLADAGGTMMLPKPDPKYLASRKEPGATPGVTSTARPSAAIVQTEPATRGAPRRTSRVAIVFGSNVYHHLPNLLFAVPDAQGVGKALEELGYEVHYGFDLTRAELLSNAYRIAREASSDLGSLAVFYSGHGISKADRSYLALRDTDPNRLEETAIDFKELQNVLAESRAQQKFFFIDANVSLPTPSTNLPRGASFFQARDGRIPSVFRVDRGFRIMLSIEPGQVAKEAIDLGHGVFSYYLIRGLRGEAAEPDGVITFESLFEYVRAAMGRQEYGRQLPVYYGDSPGAFPIGVVRPREPAAGPAK